MNKLITYFLRGLLLTAPLAVTIYLFILLWNWFDTLNPMKEYPGLGLVIVLVSVTLVGFLGTRLIFQPFFTQLEKLLNKLPLVSFVYSSLKDLVSAFVGDQRKFNHPVLVTLNQQSGIKKIGFVMQEDLSDWDIQDSVAVYLPLAYAFSGELYIVPKENVVLLNVSGTEAMKFVISGGVTRI